MKELPIEPDFIGSQEPLTQEEATALAVYFAEKKAKVRQAARRLPAKPTDHRKATT